MTQERFTPTPRNQRAKVLAEMSKTDLRVRAHALGYTYIDEAVTADELRSMILDAEQDKGLVAR